jgi:glutamyl-tRNA reductase
MNLLVVGVSHRTAPVDVLDRVALTPESVDALLARLAASAAVDEALVLATCNRVEVYAAAPQFHPAVDAIAAALGTGATVSADLLQAHLFVHHADRAVEHLFAVAAGLDSMAVGESQVRGQVRDALHRADRAGTVGPRLQEVVAHALRAGKRVQAELGVDRAAPTLADRGLDLLEHTGLAVTGSRVLVLGAGSMATVAAHAVVARGAADLVVVNRDEGRGRRLADSVGARWLPSGSLVDVLPTVDVVLACTGAQGVVLSRDLVAAARAGTAGARPLGLVDLALPHDIEPDAAALDGVVLCTLADIAAAAGDGDHDLAAAGHAIVDAEVAAFVRDTRAQRAAPTLVALRAMADALVADELARLGARRPDLTTEQADEVAATVRRVVNKLLHVPTVRVKDDAAAGSQRFEQALRHLFDLRDGEEVAP